MNLKRTFVFLLAVVTVVLGVAVLSGFGLYRSAVTDDVHESVNRTAATKATQLASILTERTRTVRLQARDPAVLGPCEVRRQTLERFVNTTSFQGVSVIDDNGTMVAIEAAHLPPGDREALIGQNFSHRGYFREAIQGHSYVSKPVTAESGNYIVTVSVPVVRDGEVVATLNAALHLQRDDEFFEPIAPRRDATAVRVVAGETVVYESEGWTHNGTIVARKPVAGTNWTVMVSRPKAAAVTPVRTAVVLQAGAVLLVLGTLVAFGGWVYRSSIQQVNELGRGFDRLVDRQYDTDVELTGSEEWTAIQGRFNEVSTELEQQTRQLSILGRVLRHNLRNDMNVIQAYAELIRDDTDGDLRTYAETIVTKGDQLLDTANKERQITELLSHPAPVESRDVAAIAHASVETAQRRYPTADVSVESVAAPTVAATPELETAIQELVINAVAHSDRSVPSVDVTVATDGSEGVVRVADDGPGIPEMEQRVLTGEQEIEPLYHGSGLGLWLVNEIVSRSGGTLSFDEHDPRGSVVTIRLKRQSRA
ncbi:MAG: sensor histidine kinase [Halorientalis sp.]